MLTKNFDHIFHACLCGAYTSDDYRVYQSDCFSLTTTDGEIAFPTTLTFQSNGTSYYQIFPDWLFPHVDNYYSDNRHAFQIGSSDEPENKNDFCLYDKYTVNSVAYPSSGHFKETGYTPSGELFAKTREKINLRYGDYTVREVGHVIRVPYCVTLLPGGGLSSPKSVSILIDRTVIDEYTFTGSDLTLSHNIITPRDININIIGANDNFLKLLRLGTVSAGTTSEARSPKSIASAESLLINGNTYPFYVNTAYGGPKGYGSYVGSSQRSLLIPESFTYNQSYYRDRGFITAVLDVASSDVYQNKIKYNVEIKGDGIVEITCTAKFAIPSSAPEGTKARAVKLLCYCEYIYRPGSTSNLDQVAELCTIQLDPPMPVSPGEIKTVSIKCRASGVPVVNFSSNWSIG